MIAYILMMWGNLRFRAGLRAQNIDLATLPFQSKMVPYSNYVGIFGIGLVLLTNGFGVFIHGYWSFANFFSAYFSIVFFLVIWAVFKVWKGSVWIRPEDMDFKTGIAEVEAHEATLVQKAVVTRYERYVELHCGFVLVADFLMADSWIGCGKNHALIRVYLTRGALYFV